MRRLRRHLLRRLIVLLRLIRLLRHRHWLLLDTLSLPILLRLVLRVLLLRIRLLHWLLCIRRLLLDRARCHHLRGSGTWHRCSRLFLLLPGKSLKDGEERILSTVLRGLLFRNLRRYDRSFGNLLTMCRCRLGRRLLRNLGLMLRDWRRGLVIVRLRWQLLNNS